LQINTKYTVS